MKIAEITSRGITLENGNIFIRLSDRVWLIPTPANSQKQIVQCEVLGFSYSDIGLRIQLGVIKKQKGINPFYSASPEMIGQSIFLTKESANKAQEKL